MNNAGGFTPISFEELFKTYEGPTMSRESWGFFPPIVSQSGTNKRKKSPSVVAKKRAKLERCFEEVDNGKTREAAKKLLDQIRDTPGQIILNFESSSGVCPLPQSMHQAVRSEWTVHKLLEGQLNSLLAEDPKKYKPIKIQPIHRGDLEDEILPRQMNTKEVIEKLEIEDKSSDQYIGFTIAVANVLRRCDAETAERITHSITTVIEQNASFIFNK